MSSRNKLSVEVSRQNARKIMNIPKNDRRIVHHMDGDPLNNDLDNLLVLPCNEDHAKLHWLQKIHNLQIWSKNYDEVGYLGTPPPSLVMIKDGVISKPSGNHWDDIDHYRGVITDIKTILSNTDVLEEKDLKKLVKKIEESLGD